MTGMSDKLIASCGMNCRLCYAFIRAENRCGGCRSVGTPKRNNCDKCSINNCQQLKDINSAFCFDCEKYPCRRLRQLDTRYRTKYHMSMLENLASIKENGMPEFLKREEERWTCPICNGIVCVHRIECPTCGRTVSE